MQKFLIKNKKSICIGGALILVLAFAFWFGGNSPSSRGWGAESGKLDSEYASADDENQEKQDDKSNGTAQGTAQLHEGEQGSQENTDSSQLQGNTNGQPSPSVSSPSSGSTVGSSSSSQGSSSPTGTTGDKQSSNSSGNTVSTGGGSSSSTVQTTPAPSYSCTISISCKNILNNMDLLKSNKVSIVPSDGWVLKPVKLELKEGDTVFDILQRATQKYKIHMEYSKSPMYNSMYIEGIANLYQFDCGDLSGWMYKVNDAFPDYGCSQYKVKDGDVIDWVYTCDLGNDIDGYAAGN